jgi:hypothetical protein
MDWSAYFFIHLHWPQEVLAQTTADELDLLKAQYANLESTFQRYVDMVQLTLVTAGGIVGVIAILGTALSIKSLKDYYDTLKSIEGKVRDEVDRMIAVALQRDRRRLVQLESMVERDLLPERIAIDYVVPANPPPRRPRGISFLLEVLKRGGFTNVVVRYEPQLLSSETASQKDTFEADIVVLDLHHAGIDQNLAVANGVIAAVGDRVDSQRSVVVVYGTARFYDGVPKLNQADKYCGASNGPLTFMARILEAAYVVDALGTFRV